MISSRCKHDRKTGDSVASLSDDITSACNQPLWRLSIFCFICPASWGSATTPLRNYYLHMFSTLCFAPGTTRTCSWIATAWIKTNQAIFHSSRNFVVKLLRYAFHACRVVHGCPGQYHAYWHFTQNSKWKLSNPRLKPLRDPANDALGHVQDQTWSRSQRIQKQISWQFIATYRNSKTTFTNIPTIEKSQCCHDDGCYRQKCTVWWHVKTGVSSVLRYLIFVCLRSIKNSQRPSKLGASLSANPRSFCKACLSLSATGVH